MSNVEKKVLDVNLFTLGRFTLECMRINAPSSIQNLMQSLPLKGKALKQGDRLIMPTQLKVRRENPKTEFSQGDVSIDPSSGNISFHLQNQSMTPTPENFLGSFVSAIETDSMPLSSGVLIKEKE